MEDSSDAVISTDSNGNGVGEQKTGAKKTLGLPGMKEGARMMSGKLELCHGEQNGLNLVVTVPLPPSPAE